MSRWFRRYADTHRNPKVAQLSDSDFRLWDQLLCMASENDGILPPADDIKRVLNRRLDHLLAALKRLISVGLIDPLGDGYSPRNWSERQYKSDTSTDRVQRHRAKRNVSETPPDTETEAETEREEGMPDKSGDYAYFGQTIKLAPRHLKDWRRLFHSIPDIVAELSTIDDWWQAQPQEKRVNWFLATKGMLNKRHQENLANRQTYDRERITV